MSQVSNRGKGEAEKERTPEEQARVEKLIKTIGSTFLLGVIQTTQCGSANSSAILAAVGGNTALAARDYATVSTLGAMLEFATGPLFGKMSDKYGRKPFAIIGAFGSVLMDFMVYLNPASLLCLRVRTIVSTMFNTMIITIVRAALSDRVSGKELGVANARIGIYAGLSVVFGPLFGTYMQKKFGSRTNFLVATLIGTLNLLNLSVNFEETLKDCDKKELKYDSSISPFSFFKLLQKGRKMAATSLSLALQCIGEPRFIFPYAQMTWESVYKYGPMRRGSFAAVFGVSYILGAIIAKKRIGALGTEGHVSESNIANLLGFFIWSTSNDKIGTLLSLFFLTFGVRKRDGLEVILVQEGNKAGWGRGETYGYIANFKSVSAVLAPLVLGNTYSYMTSKGRTFYGAPMFAAAIITCLSETVFRLRE